MLCSAFGTGNSGTKTENAPMATEIPVVLGAFWDELAALPVVLMFALAAQIEELNQVIFV